MTTFQRSEVSFRRQGSSGMVWQDRFLSGDLNQMKRQQEGKPDPKGLRYSRSDGSTKMMENNRSANGVIHRTSKVSSSIDPPSPKVSGCWLCFGKSAGARQPKTGKQKFY